MIKIDKKHIPFLVTCIGVIILALFRILPHPPNFTPLMATALFGGRYFSNVKLAFIIPIVSLFVGDIFIGFHSLMIPVYGSFIISILMGIFLKRRSSLINIAGVTFFSSIQFFIITNFAVWLLLQTYPKNIQGLITCYVNSLPFLKNSLMGNFFYTGILFGAYTLLSKKLPALREV